MKFISLIASITPHLSSIGIQFELSLMFAAQTVHDSYTPMFNTEGQGLVK